MEEKEVKVENGTKDEAETVTETETEQTTQSDAVCDFCGKHFDPSKEGIYPDRISGKNACKACDKMLRKKYRQEYFGKKNAQRKIWEAILIAIGAVLFVVIGIAGLMESSTRVIGIIFLLAGIGYGIWFFKPYIGKKKKSAGKADK